MHRTHCSRSGPRACSRSASSRAAATTAARRAARVGGGSSDKQVTIGLITKTESNPFFVKMKEGAQAQAKKDNVKLLTASGKSDTDNASQVTALENMTTQGAKVILDVPADSKADRPRDQEGARRGRDRDRARHADRAAGRGRRAVRHGQPEGRRADRPVREGQGRRRWASRRRSRCSTSRPASPSAQLRHDGFLKGFGIKEGDPQIVGAAATRGRHRQGSGGDGDAAAEGPGHQRHLLDQRAVGLRRRERAEGGRQGSEGLHPGLRRRRLRRDQARHQARRRSTRPRSSTR